MPLQRRLKLIRTFIETRVRDPHLEDRFLAVCDLVALEWILLALNVMVPREMRRKRFADPQRDEVELIRGRFDRARRLRDTFIPIAERWTNWERK